MDENIVGLTGDRHVGARVCALLFREAHAGIEESAQAMRRTRQYMSMVCVVLLAGAMFACGGPWRDGYFKKGVDRLTQDEVVEKFGPPHTAKAPVLGGDSIWTYRVPISDKELAAVNLSHLTEKAQLAATSIADGPKAMLYCYRYTLTFNEQKILKHWQREECVPGTHDTLNAN